MRLRKLKMRVFSTDAQIRHESPCSPLWSSMFRADPCAMSDVFDSTGKPHMWWNL